MFYNALTAVIFLSRTWNKVENWRA